MKSKNITLSVLLVLSVFVANLAVTGTVYAGTLTPPSGTPAVTGYTLGDIYTRITTGAAAGAHTLSSALAPAATFHTLTEIYNAIPATQTLSSANDTVAAGYYAATTLSAVDTDLAAGNIKSGTTIFGILGTLASYLYGGNDATKVLTTAAAPGTYNATNISPSTVLSGTTFGVGLGQTGTVIQSLGNATAANVLSGTTFSNATAANVSGTMTARSSDNAVTGGTVNSTSLLLTPPSGYYDGTATVSTTSANFIAGNIKNGVNLFGINGTFASGYTYGDSSAAQVLTTAAGAGTYNVTNLIASNVKSGVTYGVSLGQTGTYTAGGAQPLKTGQTLCYDAAGATIACAGLGQDGTYLKGAARSYSTTTYSTVIDNATGLMWKKCSQGQATSTTSCTGSATTMTWTAATSTCSTDTTDGYSDWRLPNQNELLSLVDYSASSPAINTTYFPATQSSGYWSSTSYKPSPSGAWVVSFYDGGTNYNGKTTSNYVRCVRG